MNIVSIAGFSVITKDSDASAALYQEALRLPLDKMEDYQFMDGFSGAHHFGVWPLRLAAQSCFGQDEWPDHTPEPTACIEFELADAESVQKAVEELKAGGRSFIHESRTEPWGQVVARFMSPEGVLTGLCFTPWLHK